MKKLITLLVIMLLVMPVVFAPDTKQYLYDMAGNKYEVMTQYGSYASDITLQKDGHLVQAFTQPIPNTYAFNIDGKTVYLAQTQYEATNAVVKLAEFKTTQQSPISSSEQDAELPSVGTSDIIPHSDAGGNTVIFTTYKDGSSAWTDAQGNQIRVLQTTIKGDTAPTKYYLTANGEKRFISEDIAEARAAQTKIQLVYLDVTKGTFGSGYDYDSYTSSRTFAGGKFDFAPAEWEGTKEEWDTLYYREQFSQIQKYNPELLKVKLDKDGEPVKNADGSLLYEDPRPAKPDDKNVVAVAPDTYKRLIEGGYSTFNAQTKTFTTKPKEDLWTESQWSYSHDRRTVTTSSIQIRELGKSTATTEQKVFEYNVPTETTPQGLPGVITSQKPTEAATGKQLSRTINVVQTIQNPDDKQEYIVSRKQSQYQTKDNKESMLGEIDEQLQVDNKGRLLRIGSGMFAGQILTKTFITDVHTDNGKEVTDKFEINENGNIWKAQKNPDGSFKTDGSGNIIYAQPKDSSSYSTSEIKGDWAHKQAMDSLIRNGQVLGRTFDNAEGFFVTMGRLMRGYDEFSGLARLSSLFIPADFYGKRYTKLVNDFCAFGGLSKCFESAICKSSLRNYNNPDSGALITQTGISAHIEGDRSTAKTGENSIYYYRVTFAFVNDAMKETDDYKDRHFNVQFIGPEKTFTWWDDADPNTNVKAGDSVTFIRQNPIIADSPTLYTKVCLTWSPAVETYGVLAPRRVSEICNNLQSLDGQKDSLTITTGQTQQTIPTPRGMRKPGDGF